MVEGRGVAEAFCARGTVRPNSLSREDLLVVAAEPCLTRRPSVPPCNADDDGKVERKRSKRKCESASEPNVLLTNCRLADHILPYNLEIVHVPLCRLSRSLTLSLVSEESLVEHVCVSFSFIPFFVALIDASASPSSPAPQLQARMNGKERGLRH